MAVVGVDDLRAAGEALRGGEVVAIPTDTVYGVAVSALVSGATDRIFALKQRPRDVELPVLVADLDQALLLADGVPDAARTLIDRFWPGALTVVLRRRPDVEVDLGTRTDTVGLRCPDHPVAIELCREIGPLATTSANLHRQPTPETAEGIAELFGPDLLVVDGGPCRGAPSTVVDCTGPEPKLLREGRIPWSDVLSTVSGAI